MDSFEKITVETLVDAPREKVWNYWTKPVHIKNWNIASDDWHVPDAMNDLKVGGKFLTRMEAKDGSEGFDFGGTYDEVNIQEGFSYTMEDQRKVDVVFKDEGTITRVIETFDAEKINSIEIQLEGWQTISNKFKKYVEEKH